MVGSVEGWHVQQWMVTVRCVSMLRCFCVVFACLILFIVCYCCFIFLLLQTGSNPFHRRCNDSSDQGQAKRQRNEGDMGRTPKVAHMERG